MSRHEEGKWLLSLEPNGLLPARIIADYNELLRAKGKGKKGAPVDLLSEDSLTARIFGHNRKPSRENVAPVPPPKDPPQYIIEEGAE